MPSFAIIAEGVTDQAVLENIVLGYFGNEEDEPVVTYVQPPRDARPKAGNPAPGGWTLVFRSLQQGDHRKALQLNDYVILHLDTDVSEEKGYDVSRRDAAGQPLAPEALVEQVRLRLVQAMGPELGEQHARRIVLAIAVDSIECWLLPLLYDDEATKKAKLTGCLDAADRKLRRLNRPPLSTAGSKTLASYEKASKDYRKHRELMKHRGENPSLDVFVRNLEALGAESPGEPENAPGNTAESAGSPGEEPGGAAGG